MNENLGSEKVRPNGADHSVPCDPFDPQNHKQPQDLRLDPGEDQGNTLPAVIEARKPKASWFFRIHKGSDYRVVLPLFEEDSEKQKKGATYLFHPQFKVPEELEGLVRYSHVCASITSGGVPFLYVLKPSETGWYSTGMEAIRCAIEGWVRVESVRALGGYRIFKPVADLGEPHFPDAPMRDWIRSAFSERVVNSLDHPLVKRLRGAL